jgi:hypothetical protein
LAAFPFHREIDPDRSLEQEGILWIRREEFLHSWQREEGNLHSLAAGGKEVYLVRQKEGGFLRSLAIGGRNSTLFWAAREKEFCTVRQQVKGILHS